MIHISKSLILRLFFRRNIHEEPDDLETPQERRARWNSIRIIYFTMFLMSLGFSIILTGVWPYLDKVSNISAISRECSIEARLQWANLMGVNILKSLFVVNRTRVFEICCHF